MYFLKNLFSVLAILTACAFATTSSSSSQSNQYATFDMGHLSTCCLGLMVGPAFRLQGKSFEPDTETRITPDAISISKETPSCSPFSDLLQNETSVTRKYLFAIMYRTCQSVSLQTENAIFKMDYVGSSPYTEITPEGKYRFRFFSNLSSFPIERVLDMGAAEKTYLDIKVTINILNFTDEDGHTSTSRIFGATIDCDGSWRNFFSSPGDYRELFSGESNSLTLAQTESCENILLNSFRQKPGIAKKVN